MVEETTQATDEELTQQAQWASELVSRRAQEMYTREDKTQVVKEALEEAWGGNVSDEEAGEYSTEIPNKMAFPIFMFGLGVTKDLLDVLLAMADLTVIAIIITWIIKIAILVMFFVWLLGKMSLLRKRVIRKILLPAIVAALAGLIPILSAFYPDYSFLAFMAWAQHNKHVDAILTALEKAEGKA